MKLNSQIILSKKHQKAFEFYPYFFIPSLNNFYQLHAENGFTKPKLFNWRDEALIEFKKNENRILLQYLWPNYVEIRITKDGQSRNKDFMLSKKFKTIKENSAQDIDHLLNEYYQTILSDIFTELNKREST